MQIRVVPFHAGLMPPMTMGAFALSVPAGSVVIFVKSAAKGLTAEHLEPLRRRGARIGLDSIDLPLDAIDFDLFDFHIAASLAGKAALEERLSALGMADVPVEQLHHHYDPMIPAPGGEDRPFRCGYVGELPNAFIPRRIAGEIDCVDVRYARDFTTALDRIAEFTLHYGVRPTLAPRTLGARQYKPFTKGFTAAAFDANILVNREADDAVCLLGKDYPFLVSASDPDSVVAGFERAKSGTASPEWREGLERMRALKELVAPAALAARMREIVNVVSA
ncbi:MAG: hypothetical protein HKN27_08240 [Silicimonas sp.]|nr:hypothetical protein [Silicimonas sp.]